jgi:hypothetical protein
MYDRQCANGHQMIDCWEPMYHEDIVCTTCGAETKRLWLGKTAAVIQDTIEGGLLVEHGICNEDGSARKYYSKSEMAREAKRKGLVNLVRHVTPPDTDKSKHTSRWI